MFYSLHGGTTKFLRGGEKCYIYFADNSLLFPTVKEFSQSVNRWWSYCKKFDTTFFWNTFTNKVDLLRKRIYQIA